MAEKLPQVAKADFHREIVKMASEDKAFRKRLLADPKQALKAAVGFDAPPGLDVQVLQEDPKRFYIVLPPEPEAFKELREEELGAVAGGAGARAALGQQLQGFVAGNFLQKFQGQIPGQKLSPGALAGARISWG